MAQILVDGIPVEQVISEYKSLKKENQRLSKINSELRDQLKNQGVILDREKRNNVRYRALLDRNPHHHIVVIGGLNATTMD